MADSCILQLSLPDLCSSGNRPQSRTQEGEALRTQPSEQLHFRLRQATILAEEEQYE